MSNNLYKRLLRLIPGPIDDLGEVIAADTGTATVELLTGGIVQAKGAAEVGQFVYLRDGVIIAEAEAPAGSEIEE